jgi:hypothetical protein
LEAQKRVKKGDLRSRRRMCDRLSHEGSQTVSYRRRGAG